MINTQTQLNFESEVPASIIDKIRKLKALSEGAAAINSLEESEAAALAVNKLLIKYNLSLLDINPEEPENKSALNIEKSDEIPVRNTYGRLWKERLLNVLCGYHYCKPLATSHRCIIVGTKLNITVVLDLFNTLQSVYQHHAKESYEAAKVYFKGGRLTEKYKRKYITSYLLGFSIGLSVKLQRIETQECKAIAIRHDNLINDYLNENFKLKSKPLKKVKTNDSAYNKGFYKGMNTELNKSIE